jgi:ectoine hydroxylase-related dioxygenase (phytanoyl-CoA dioxygenase family)
VTIESGPVRFIVGSNHWATIAGLDFFNKGIQSQNQVLDQSHSNRETVDALLEIGEVSVHSSLTYHSSNANRNQEPRVGMVVHFCTDEAKRIMVTGENSDYLDQIKNPTIAPVIYQG